MKLLRNLLFVLSLVFAGAVWAEAVNINTADVQMLETLDGIGPAKAQAIVQYREQNGPFQDVEQLAEVDGIGAKTLEKLKPAISVE